MNPAPFDDLLGVALLAVPLLVALPSLRRRREPVAMSSEQRIVLYWSNAATMAVLAGAVVALWVAVGRPLAGLGLTLEQRSPIAGLGLAALFLVLYTLDAVREVSADRIADTRERWRRDTPFLPTDARELRHSWAMVVAAAVGEEILFRGYLIAWLLAVFGDGRGALAAAIGLPAAAFGIAHLYQRWAAVAKIVGLSAIFGAILIVTGSLLIPIVLHFVVDAVGFVLGPRVLAGGDRPGEPATPAAGGGLDSGVG